MYEWIKAAHLASVLVFAGGLTGLFMVSRAVRAAGPMDPDTAHRLKHAALRWDRRITLPALGLVWAFGMWAAMDGGWFAQPWLQVKLLFVIFLSALHGVLSGRLRRADARQGQTGWFAQSVILPSALLLSLAAIAVLVIVRPF